MAVTGFERSLYNGFSGRINGSPVSFFAHNEKGKNVDPMVIPNFFRMFRCDHLEEEAIVTGLFRID